MIILMFGCLVGAIAFGGCLLVGGSRVGFYTELGFAVCVLGFLGTMVTLICRRLGASLTDPQADAPAGKGTPQPGVRGDSLGAQSGPGQSAA